MHFDAHGGALARRRRAGRAPAERPLDLSPSCSSEVDAFAAGLLALGPRARRPRRHLVAEQRRMGDHPVRHRQGRADPGQHQPGLSPGRARIRAEQGRLQGADHRRPRFKTSDYLGMLRSWRRSSRRAQPGALKRRELPALRTRRSRSAATIARHATASPTIAGLADDGHRAAPRRSSPASCSSTIRSTSSSPPARPARPRARRSPTTTSSTTASSSARRCGSTEHDRICIPVPLYHCFGMVLGNLACITHGAAMVYPGEGFDPLAVLRDRRRPSAARRSTACRPCSSPSSTIPSSSSFDLSHPAHRHHGRLALPDRGDARVVARDAHARGDHRLRHDRDQPGQLPDRGRRSARAARLDRRPRPPASRGEDRRRRGPHRAARRRRASSAPAAIR